MSCDASGDLSAARDDRQTAAPRRERLFAGRHNVSRMTESRAESGASTVDEGPSAADGNGPGPDDSPVADGRT
ncbi:hypothetical protein C475_02764 [Halosimplex carlsbadense 2-9-1]|uniref:Uncharacterized protein n=1 Tax=Halosimplex carlsbadense 2-9-1 TaxID=797114 RepID=M0D410_9EURY|nr:hypothetical protein C475_02764 [Halosimplex carlsbadense 2-9-1]